MPRRFLPNSNPTRYRALRMVKERKDAVPPPTIIPFLASTITRFDTFFPQYKAKYLAVTSKLGQQTPATKQVNDAEQLAKYFIWDFIDALQKAIRRGTFDEEVRSLYGLPLHKSALPELTSEQDVLDWGDKIHEGETNRIAAGGAPITFPSLAQVDAAVDNFRTLNIQQSELKDEYDTAQEELEALNPEADKLILKLWNEIEAAFDEGDKPSMRRKSREWGVYYLPKAGEALSPDEFSITGKITVEGVGGTPAIADVLVTVVETGSTSISEGNGDYFISLLPPGTYTLQFEKEGYVTKTLAGNVVTAGVIITVNTQLTPTGSMQGQVTEAGIGQGGVVSIDGTSHTTPTDPMGNYTLTEIAPGNYVARAALNSNPANFQTQNITINPGGTVTVNFPFP